MAASNGEKIIKRYEQLKTKRANHESRWERHSPYMSPWSYGVITKEVDGEATQTQVYDSTAIFANTILANFICGEIINPAEKYISFRHADNTLNELDEVKEWSEECTERVLAEMARSNFYTEAPTMVDGVTGFGTGSLFRGERLRDVSEREAKPGWRGFRFKTDKIGRFAIAEDQNGEIKTNYREFIYTAGQAAERWQNLPSNIQECVRSDKLDETFTIVHAVEPRASSDRTYGNRGMAFKSCYVELKEKYVFEEGGFEDYPFTNPRWEVIPGEVYGRCPGDVAFNDIVTLNAAKRLDHEAWALDARPPTFVRHDTGLATFSVLPGMFVSVRSQPGRPLSDSFHPYVSNAQHEVNELREQQTQQAIRQAYFVDQILQMLEVEKTQMTAYEFGRKMELLFRILGPVYGRFQNEFLKPTFDGVFMDMYRSGALPPLPDVITETGDGRIDIEFHNPLARAQKTGEVESLNFAIADLTPLVTMEMQTQGYSETLDWLDRDKAAKMVFDVRGVPATVVRSDKEVDKVRGARAEAQAEQRKAQEAMMATEAVKNVAPALKSIQGGKAA